MAVCFAAESIEGTECLLWTCVCAPTWRWCVLHTPYVHLVLCTDGLVWATTSTDHSTRWYASTWHVLEATLRIPCIVGVRLHYCNGWNGRMENVFRTLCHAELRAGRCHVMLLHTLKDSSSLPQHSTANPAVLEIICRVHCFLGTVVQLFQQIAPKYNVKRLFCFNSHL